jgi:hypothetical protein
VDSLSTDVTLLTIGGDEKLACRTADALMTLPDGTQRSYGRFSWTFAQALLNTPPHSSWISILSEMERLAQRQHWDLPLLFHGQPTQAFCVRE